jgi:hypothetical protein
MQLFVGGGNAIFFLLTVLFTGFLALVALVAWKRKNQSTLRAAIGVGAVVLGVYSALLISAALASRERVLAAGEVKWFCGFYLDCHLGVSVAKVESAKTIAGTRSTVTAHDLFMIVTLELHNSARNPNLDMTLFKPTAFIVDAGRNRYQRNAAAEQAITGVGRFEPPLEERMKVGHSPVQATLVFDVPADAKSPKLSLDEGFFLDRLIELVLVNDDNSLFHKPTFLALSDEDARPSRDQEQSTRILRVRLASR